MLPINSIVFKSEFHFKTFFQILFFIIHFRLQQNKSNFRVSTSDQSILVSLNVRLKKMDLLEKLREKMTSVIFSKEIVKGAIRKWRHAYLEYLPYYNLCIERYVSVCVLVCLRQEL